MSLRITVPWKRPIDIIFSSVLFLLYGVPVIIAAIAVYFDDSSGPVIYWQTRIGKDENKFKLPKLRTMYTKKEISNSVDSENRITNVGKYIRTTTLDEIPQIWCVYRQDMSVIGPRPIMVEEHKKISREIDDWDRRTSIKPGIGGTAQVQKIDTDTPEKMLLYDLNYINSYSMLLDVVIFLKMNYLLTKWITLVIISLTARFLFNKKIKPRRGFNTD